jgi:hypothetical protein
MNVENGRQNTIFLFGNNDPAQFSSWEYINENQTFILGSHRPFICSAVVESTARMWTIGRHQIQYHCFFL